MVGREPTVSDAEILHEFVVSPDAVLTSTEVAEAVDMSRQGVASRFEQLAEDGFLKTKKVGAHARVWWITERGREFYASNY